MKKAFEIIKTVFTWVVVVITAFMVVFTIISVTTVDKNSRNLFGYMAFIVRSDSMKATDFDAGDLVISKVVDPATLREGDIISFRSNNPESRGEVFTHKIRSLTTDENGNPGFITYGTSTNTDDETVVTYSYVLGKYIGYAPNLGTFFAFMKTTPGYLLCILLPLLYLIISQGFKSIRLAGKYKSDLFAEVEEERAREKAELATERKVIVEERKKQEAMLQELLRIQAELRGEKSPSNALAEPDDSIQAGDGDTALAESADSALAETGDDFDDDILAESDDDFLTESADSALAETGNAIDDILADSDDDFLAESDDDFLADSDDDFLADSDDDFLTESDDDFLAESDDDFLADSDDDFLTESDDDFLAESDDDFLADSDDDFLADSDDDFLADSDDDFLADTDDDFLAESGDDFLADTDDADLDDIDELLKRLAADPSGEQ